MRISPDIRGLTRPLLALAEVFLFQDKEFGIDISLVLLEHFI